MARQFRQITSRFWTGRTAVRMRTQPIETRAVAFYLATAPTSHMTGLYYITVGTIAGDLGITTRRVVKALQWLSSDGYCYWDDDNSVVWVRQMARHQIGASLEARDNRVTAILDQLREYKHSPLAGEFVRHYWDAYHFAEIAGRDDFDAELLPMPPDEPPPTPRTSPSGGPPIPPSKPLESPSPSFGEAPCEAPSKPLESPLRSQRAENREQGTETRDSGESERVEPRAASRARGPAGRGSLTEPLAPDALLEIASPLANDHPDREACIAALWAHQNQLRAGVDPSQPPVPAEPLPGGNWDPVRQAVAKYAPVALVTALFNAAIEAECKRDLGEDPLEFFNGETNWRAAQLLRLLATTPEAIRKRYRRKSKNRAGPSGRRRGPAEPHPSEEYAGGRVAL